jgi:hypothetical protein
LPGDRFAAAGAVRAGCAALFAFAEARLALPRTGINQP